MSDDTHHHTTYDSDGVPDTYVSESDGSCVVCRREAEAAGDCGHCYGRGSFDCVPDCQCDDEHCTSSHAWSFTCPKCKGSGRKA